MPWLLFVGFWCWCCCHVDDSYCRRLLQNFCCHDDLQDIVMHFQNLVLDAIVMTVARLWNAFVHGLLKDLVIDVMMQCWIFLIYVSLDELLFMNGYKCYGWFMLGMVFGNVFMYRYDGLVCWMAWLLQDFGARILVYGMIARQGMTKWDNQGIAKWCKICFLLLKQHDDVSSWNQCKDENVISIRFRDEKNVIVDFDQLVEQKSQ